MPAAGRWGPGSIAACGGSGFARNQKATFPTLRSTYLSGLFRAATSSRVNRGAPEALTAPLQHTEAKRRSRADGQDKWNIAAVRPEGLGMSLQDIHHSKTETRRSRPIMASSSDPAQRRPSRQAWRKYAPPPLTHPGLVQEQARQTVHRSGTGRGPASGRARLEGRAARAFCRLRPRPTRPHLDVHQGAERDQQQQAGAHCGAGSRGAGARVHRSCCCCWRLQAARGTLADDSARALSLRAQEAAVAWALVPAAAAVAAAIDPSYGPPAGLARPASVHACHM